MANNNKNSKSLQDLKCIWMASNLVDYKLCDKSFDCENCPFDKVMRNLSGSDDKISEAPVEIIDRIINKLKQEEFNAKYIYLKNHLLVKHLFANTYYLGLSPIILSILDNINSVEHLPEVKFVERNDELLTITGDWGNVKIKSPINHNLLEKIKIAPEFLSEHKWFSIVNINPKELTVSKISRGKWINDNINTIELLSNYSIDTPIVGTTMQDGGLKIKYLYQLIGKKEYLNILNKLFDL